MRIGSLEFRRDPGPQAEDPSVYPARLADLARMLCGLTWLLVGGLSIPVTRGTFYRRHYDVDIAFPIEAFPDVERTMLGAGYYLDTYFPASFFGRARVALHVPVRCDSRLARWRTRKLKFRDATGTRRAPHLLSVIEALPYRIDGEFLATCDGRHRLRIDRPLVGHREVTEAGHEIPCLDLQYVARLKSGPPRPKDALDLAMISEARPSAKAAGRP